MDPLSQGVVGAAAALWAASPKRYHTAALLGGLAGMAPDLDVFIRSELDPMLGIEMHRHFTHSIFFIPVGAFVCAAFFYFLSLCLRKCGGFVFFVPRRKAKFAEYCFYTLMGIATAGLLDLFTSYGTNYLWPLVDKRYSWDFMPIIDPIFTGVLVILLAMALLRQSSRFRLAMTLFMLAYFSLGLVQRERAIASVEALAATRGDTIQRLRVLPSPMSLMLWRGIYDTGQEYVCDGHWLGYAGGSRHYEGGRVQPHPIENLRKDYPDHQRQLEDIERFAHFSQGWNYAAEGEPYLIGDFRYSLFASSIRPLWAIRFVAGKTESHVEHAYFHRLEAGSWERFVAMQMGRDLPESDTP